MKVYFMQHSTIARASTVTAAKKRGRCRLGKSNTTASILQGVDKGTWWIGRIQKMQRRAGTNSWGSIKQPVDLANRDETPGKKGTTVSNIEVILQYYSRAAGQYKFKYNVTDSKWITVESIITNVTLTLNAENQVYNLDRSDAEALNEYVFANA